MGVTPPLCELCHWTNRPGAVQGCGRRRGGGDTGPKLCPPKCCAGSQIFDAWFNDGKTVSTSRQRSETAREMLLYLLKSPIPQWWKTGNDPQSVSGTGSLPKVNQFLQLVGPIITPRFTEIGWLLLQWSSSQTDRHLTDRQTSDRQTRANDKQQRSHNSAFTE